MLAVIQGAKQGIDYQIYLAHVMPLLEGMCAGGLQIMLKQAGTNLKFFKLTLYR